MRLLIDTHVLVWLLQGSKSLGPNTRITLSDNSSYVAISYFSLLEMKLKALRGKLNYDGVESALIKLNIDVIYPDIDVLDQLIIYNPSNKDPFDNLLITTALQNKLTLITDDQFILGTKVPRLTLMSASK